MCYHDLLPRGELPVSYVHAFHVNIVKRCSRLADYKSQKLHTKESVIREERGNTQRYVRTRSTKRLVSHDREEKGYIYIHIYIYILYVHVFKECPADFRFTENAPDGFVSRRGYIATIVALVHEIRSILSRPALSRAHSVLSQLAAARSYGIKRVYWIPHAAIVTEDLPRNARLAFLRDDLVLTS